MLDKLNADTLKQQLTDQGLRNRPSQLSMIETAFKALKEKSIAVIEAPTGVGKTLAYTLSALLAKDKKTKIIVSTATIALQEQLINKDIPLCEKILQNKITAGLAKGRRRYVCLSRLYRGESAEEKFASELQQRVESKIWNGEKETLGLHVSEAEWQTVSTDQSGCSGSRCEFFEDCVFYRKRRKVLASDVVIVNHSLLLADLSLGGGVVLPPVEDCIYIIDECHHLPQKALGHFAKQASLVHSLDWINTLSKSLNNVGLYLSETEYSAKKIQEASRKLVDDLNLFRGQVDTNQSHFEKDIWRLNDEAALQFANVAENVSLSAANLADENQQVLNKLEARYEHEKALNKDKADAIDALVSRLHFVQERLDNLAVTCRDFIKGREHKQAPKAKWIEDYTLHVAPITAGRELYEMFWSRLQQGAILCSATIKTLGGFKDFLRRSGLNFFEKTITEHFDSSFDFSHSHLLVPTMQYEPNWRDTQKHNTESAELMQALFLNQAGNLVLFSSRHALEDVYALLPKSLQALILIQGATGKAALIALHKRRVDQGKTSIIFGLASFAEGLDLAGQYCEHVIIHKIPFSTPQDPVELTRSEWIKQNNLDAFGLYALPHAALRLTQYVGRLLRTEADRGMVSILDKRLYTKAYGKRLLKDLPPLQQSINLTIRDFKTQSGQSFEFMDA